MAETSPSELKQTYLNERRHFFLEPNRVRVFSKGANGEVEFYVQYEDLTSQIRHLTEQSGRLYIVAISFGVFSLVGHAANLAGEPALMRWVPLWTIAALILFAFHLAKRRRYLLLDLTDGKTLFFLRDKPSERELSDFLATMQSKRKQYLRDTYYKIDMDNDPQREVMKFKWLKTEGVISEIEFEEVKKACERRGDGDMDTGSPPSTKPRVH